MPDYRSRRKVTPAMEREILRMSVEDGANTRAISASIEQKFGVSVSHAGVGAVLRRTRETREEVAKSVVQESLAKSLFSDLDRLEEIRKEVADRRAKAMKGKRGTLEHKDYVALARLEKDIVEKKIHLGGGGGGDPGKVVTETPTVTVNTQVNVPRAAVVVLPAERDE